MQYATFEWVNPKARVVGARITLGGFKRGARWQKQGLRLKVRPVGVLRVAQVLHLLADVAVLNVTAQEARVGESARKRCTAQPQWDVLAPRTRYQVARDSIAEGLSRRTSNCLLS